MTPTCNICGGGKFNDYKGRPGEMCQSCKGKARHRVALAVYQRLLFPLIDNNPGARVLHMAPEPSLYPVLSKRLGAAYTVSDAEPERYPYAPCLRLRFPEDFAQFPDGYFHGIIHNHILEHIAGHYGDHLNEFARLLAPGGRMIFSFPGPYSGIETIEGGEFMATDEERIFEFGMPEHIKIFGPDFYDVYKAVPGGYPMNDGVTDELRASLNVRPGMAPFHIWQRLGGDDNNVSSDHDGHRHGHSCSCGCGCGNSNEAARIAGLTTYKPPFCQPVPPRGADNTLGEATRSSASVAGCDGSTIAAPRLE